MTCEVFRRQLESILESSWESGELMPNEQMLLHTSSCGSCRARLEAARRLLGPGPEPGRISVPAGLERRILRHVAQDRSRRRSRLALVAAAAMLVATTAIATISFTSRRPTLVEVQLTLVAPGASAVSVVGDWNGWDPSAQPLVDRDGDGIWELRFRLEPDREYEYQFVVNDDDWISDPEALIQVDDGFGGTNSVLDI